MTTVDPAAGELQIEFALSFLSICKFDAPEE
jgi:hypothetical protein